MSRGLSNLLVVAGSVGMAGSVLWWHAFYKQVAQFLEASGPLPTECIYTISGPCSMVTGVANAFGAAAYDPKLFWASVAVLVIGVIFWMLPDGSRVEENQYKDFRRKDPSP